MAARITGALGFLVGLGGFEPPTSPLSGVRSNQLSYRPNHLVYYDRVRAKAG